MLSGLMWGDTPQFTLQLFNRQKHLKQCNSYSYNHRCQGDYEFASVCLLACSLVVSSVIANLWMKFQHIFGVVTT